MLYSARFEVEATEVGHFEETRPLKFESLPNRNRKPSRFLTVILSEVFIMKKSFAAALAAAVVMGASSTSFAAANPFSDVPAGHWAYKSVTDLAEAGIVEGYGDGTYRGDRVITRYEMAQMVAKALANIDRYEEIAGISRSSLKANIDRLTAEFRSELEALGVFVERTDELWRYHDKVTWAGELRYRYYSDKEDIRGGGDRKKTKNQLQLRLLPTAEVNDHWKIKARLTASNDMRSNSSGDFKLTFAYAEGHYDKLTLLVGKMPFYTNVDDGLIMDDFFSGAAAIYGDKFKVALPANAALNDATASYQGAEISYDNDGVFLGAGYHHFRSDDFRNLPGYKRDKNANVWTVGARFDINGFGIGGAYAQNTKADQFKRSWWAGLSYKGANRREAGTWGISAAYRYVGQNVSLAPTYDTFALRTNKKGVDVGLDWAPWKNTYAQVGYFWGKTLDTNQDDRTFFGRFSWFF